MPGYQGRNQTGSRVHCVRGLRQRPETCRACSGLPKTACRAEGMVGERVLESRAASDFLHASIRLFGRMSNLGHVRTRQSQAPALSRSQPLVQFRQPPWTPNLCMRHSWSLRSLRAKIDVKEHGHAVIACMFICPT